MHCLPPELNNTNCTVRSVPETLSKYLSERNHPMNGIPKALTLSTLVFFATSAAPLLAQTPEERGLAIANEADARDQGYVDSIEHEDDTAQPGRQREPQKCKNQEP